MTFCNILFTVRVGDRCGQLLPTAQYQSGMGASRTLAARSMKLWV